MYRSLRPFTFATLLILGISSDAPAQITVPFERLCDTQFEDCRAPLLYLIQHETQGIDVAFWFMEDGRFATELIKRHQAGVPVRVLVDQRANASKRLNETMLKTLRDAGVPMREKYTGDILHFKMMLFHGQNMLEFSKANYTPISFNPVTPNVNYYDEAIFFTNDTSLLNSFLKRFEDLWTSTSQYRNFANITQPLTRLCPACTIDPSVSFSPTQNFATRSVGRYNAETEAIDAIVYRASDHRHADAMINAVKRGVPVRIIIEPDEYRNPGRVWVGKHVDRMYMGGVQLKIRKHAGLAHEASVVMHGLGEVIFGSSNWTTASTYQEEHNYFYRPSLGKPWFFQFFADQFEKKWNDTVNYAPFKPLPPTSPTSKSPANVSTGVGSSVTLTWDGGPWSHLYDVYFGTEPNPPRVATNVEIGTPEEGVLEKYPVTNLLPGTTYYWRVVGRTWANLANSGPTWSFTTAGTPPGGGGSTPYRGTAAMLPGTFQAEDFDDGGISVAYLDTTTGNSGNAYRPTDVDIQTTTDAGGGYNVGWTKAGEWLKYTVNVGATGTYTLETRVANVGTGATFRIEVDGVDRSGPIGVPNTGAYQTWQTISTPGIPLTDGQRVIRIVFLSVSAGGGVGNFNWFRLTEDSSPSSTTPYGGTPAALPGIVQMENFDIGVGGIAYYDTAAGNSGSAYRTTDVDIGTTNDPSNAGYYVGWTRVGEWLTYSVNAPEARNYSLSVRVANVGSGATFRVEVNGVTQTGTVALPDTGGWDVWQTLPVGPISLSQGSHVIRLVIVSRNTQNSGAGNFGYLAFQ